MTCIIHEQKRIDSLLEIVVYIITGLTDGVFDVLVVRIPEHLDLVSFESDSTHTTVHCFDIIHRLRQVPEAFLSFDLAQLGVIAATDDQGDFSLVLEKHRGRHSLEILLLFLSVYHFKIFFI